MTSIRHIAPTAAFGFNLLRAEAQSNSGQNVLLSPLSISAALGLTANGARGTTLQIMNKVLGLPDYKDDNAFNSRAYANLLADIKDKNLGVKLSVANAIWAQEGIEFCDEFFTRGVRDFKANLMDADFSDPRTLRAINTWVKAYTQDKIETILDEINPAAVMYLLNALYFKGTWKNQFDRSLTKDLTFHAAGGDKQHPTMFRNGEMRYGETGDYQIVALPFGEGDAKRVHLYVLLPAAGKTAEQVVGALDGDKFFREICAQRLYERDGNLWLPRFSLEYKVELVETLTTLGMGEAFSDGANFAGMHETLKLHISRVIHKCIAAFDEEGGELAAATAVEMEYESVAAAPWEMRVDRPFVAILADEETGVVIGAGIVINP